MQHPFDERFFPSGIISDENSDVESFTNILDECIEDWGIKKGNCIVISNSLVIIRKVSIPTDIKDDEIHGYLYLELGSSIHLPFDGTVLIWFHSVWKTINGKFYCLLHQKSMLWNIRTFKRSKT